MLPTIEIDEHGDCRTLYADALDLQELGTLGNFRRASHIVFSEPHQAFTVIDARTGKPVYLNRSRSACIEWEIKHFAPGGMYDHG